MLHWSHAWSAKQEIRCFLHAEIPTSLKQLLHKGLKNDGNGLLPSALQNKEVLNWWSLAASPAGAWSRCLATGKGNPRNLTP